MKLGNRYSQHSFATIPDVRTARSRFDRSYPVKGTYYFDQLTPIFVDEILPGDTVNLNLKAFMRLAPQVKPVLDNMMVDFFWFFVPNRLVWDNWEKFNGARDNPNDSTDYLIPQVEAGEAPFGENSIFDNMGVYPYKEGLSVNALPFRAYNLIYNEWFRDQNIQNSIPVPKDDGPDNRNNYAIYPAAKRHDYFTSCLPWPQKGPAIDIPLGVSAPVRSNDEAVQMYTGVDSASRVVLSGTSATTMGLQGYSAASSGVRFGDETGLQADLTDAIAPTINELRQAFMMQSLLELDARGGTRYVEILRAHFNVVSPDFRLQRPEFLSSGTIYINQHPVAQTSETTESGTPQGNLASFSTAASFDNKVGFTKSFVEHGYVLGLMRARGEVTYQQGLNKMWSRRTRWDFFWPKLQQLGEQAVLNKELYVQGTEDDDEVFGYQERYAEYKYHPGEIRGRFRSESANTLDVWHLAQEFDSLPTLSQEFIWSQTPIERSLVITEGEPHILADFFFDYKHARPMTTHGVPATLGRF